MTQVHLRVITNSEAKTFRRCAREHHYSYGLGYRAAHEAEALRFGSLIHTGLEAWWRASVDGLRLGAARAAIEGKAHDDFELARATVLLTGYDARWLDEMQHYAVLAVESEFRAPLVNPDTGAPSRTFELGGKLDALVSDRRDGLTKLVEHKTSSEDLGAGSAYWKRLQMDPQISTYFAGAKSAGYDIAECIYDVIGKPALRPSKATPLESRKYTAKGALYANQREHDDTPAEFEARLAEHVASNPERYYQRGAVVRLESEERDAAFDMWSTARLIREAELAGRHVRNPDACVRYSRECEFFGVCTGVASLDDETQFRRVVNPHEELSSEVADAA